MDQKREPLLTEGRHARLFEAQETVNGILLGKDLQVRLSFCCLLSRGHLLIEDVPGVGKTTLANAMARVIGHRLPAYSVHQ